MPEEIIILVISQYNWRGKLVSLEILGKEQARELSKHKNKHVELFQVI